MLTLFPRIRPNPLPPPPDVPEALEASEARQSATTVALDVAPTVEVPSEAATETRAPISLQLDVAAKADQAPDHAESLHSAMATGIVESAAAAQHEPFIVEIGAVAPDGNTATSVAALDESAAVEMARNPAVIDSAPQTDSSSATSQGDGVGIVEGVSVEPADPANSTTVSESAPLANSETAAAPLTAQLDGAAMLIVAGANIFDELDTLHEAATENASLMAAAPVATSPAQPEAAETVTDAEPPASLEPERQAPAVELDGETIREVANEPPAVKAIVPPAAIEIEWDENLVAPDAPTEVTAEVQAAAPSAESASIEPAQLDETPVAPEMDGTAIEAATLASGPEAESAAIDKTAAEAIAQETVAEVLTSECAAPEIPATNFAVGESAAPEPAAGESAAMEAAAVESTDTEVETSVAETEAAPSVVQTETAKPAPIMPRKPKRSKESFFELMRVPEPEAMEDSDEVAAYASAAAQAHLEAIDDTFVAHAQLLLKGRERGRALDIGTGPGQIVIKLGYRLTRWKFTGVDRSAAMIEKACQSLASAPEVAGRIEFRTADGNSLDFPDGAFDLVVCNSVLHHMEEPQNLFSEIARVVKPDGAVLLRDLRRPRRFGYRAQVRKNGKHYAGEMRRLYIASLHAGYTEEELEKMVAASALHNVTLFTHNKTHIGIQRAIGTPSIQKRK